MNTVGSRWQRRSKRLAVIASLLVATLLGTTVQASAGDPYKNQYGRGGEAPVFELRQDGAVVKVVVPIRANPEVERVAFKLRSIDTDAVVEGETAPPQLKLVLADGETYELTIRARRTNGTWSSWSKPVRVTGGVIETYPWTILAEAGDRGLHLRWADTRADSYHYTITNRRGRTVLAGQTDATSAWIEGLRNGKTYLVSIQAQYDERRTEASPAIPITPNAGAQVSINERDFTVEPLAKPSRLTAPTAITGSVDRVDRVKVRFIATGQGARSRRAFFDKGAVATAGVRGAWVTRSIRLPVLDHELISVAKGDVTNARGRVKTGVLASSLQTWVLAEADAFAPGSTAVTRVGTFR